MQAYPALLSGLDQRAVFVFIGAATQYGGAICISVVLNLSFIPGSQNNSHFLSWHQAGGSPEPPTL